MNGLLTLLKHLSHPFLARKDNVLVSFERMNTTVALRYRGCTSSLVLKKHNGGGYLSRSTRRSVSSSSYRDQFSNFTAKEIVPNDLLAGKGTYLGRVWLPHSTKARQPMQIIYIYLVFKIRGGYVLN